MLGRLCFQAVTEAATDGACACSICLCVQSTHQHRLYSGTRCDTRSTLHIAAHIGASACKQFKNRESSVYKAMHSLCVQMHVSHPMHHIALLLP